MFLRLSNSIWPGEIESALWFWPSVSVFVCLFLAWMSHLFLWNMFYTLRLLIIVIYIHFLHLSHEVGVARIPHMSSLYLSWHLLICIFRQLEWKYYKKTAIYQGMFFMCCFNNWTLLSSFGLGWTAQRSLSRWKEDIWSLKSIVHLHPAWSYFPALPEILSSLLIKCNRAQKWSREIVLSKNDLSSVNNRRGYWIFLD